MGKGKIRETCLSSILCDHLLVFWKEWEWKCSISYLIWNNLAILAKPLLLIYVSVFVSITLPLSLSLSFSLFLSLSPSVWSVYRLFISSWVRPFRPSVRLSTETDRHRLSVLFWKFCTKYFNFISWIHEYAFNIVYYSHYHERTEVQWYYYQIYPAKKLFFGEIVYAFL